MDRSRGTRRMLLTFVTALLAFFGFTAPGPVTATAAPSGVHFEHIPTKALPTHHLLDIGASDFDDDGRLDLFTTNHKFGSALLHNEGGGKFEDDMAQLGLSPSRAFPGLERLKAPEMDKPGVYVWMRSPSGRASRSFLEIRPVGMPAQARFTFGSDKVQIERKADAEVDVGRSDAGQPNVTVNAAQGAVVEIGVRHIDLPIVANFDTPSPGNVLVGSDAVPATTSPFLMTLRDRHGFAFADLGGDRDTDLFAVSGGLGGGITLPGYRGQIQDELMIGRGAGFADESIGSGLDKGSCRGREAAAVDVDGDGLLDLFEGCEGAAPSIYRQVSPTHFAPFPAPDSVATTFRWADVHGDGRLELLAAEEGGVAVYSFDSGEPVEIQRVHVAAKKGRVAQFALNDIDNDGDLDVLAVAHTGNTLLENVRNHHLHPVSLERYGLPHGSVAASFVDFDNDGLVDLHLIPQGLYHRTSPTSFRPTGELRADARAGVTTWADLDNDGLRDPVVASGTAAFSNRKDVRVSHNAGPGGHWIEVDLRGPAGNAQAIGARVQVRCGKGKQFGFVGESDDSRYSQGHYRLYFGLGSCSQVRQVAVRWPDGSRDRLKDVRADRVLRIAQS